MNRLLQKVLLILFIVGFVGIVMGGYLAAEPKWNKKKGLGEEMERIQKCIEDKQREIALIKAKQRRFNTDREFVESLARQNRRVFPGELVFVFDD